MQNEAFLNQITQRIQAHGVEQRALAEQWVGDYRKLAQLRSPLVALCGGLAVGVGLGLGFRLGGR